MATGTWVRKWVHPDEKKTKALHMRMSEEHHELLRRQAIAAGYAKVSDYVRNLIEVDCRRLTEEGKIETSIT